MDGGSGYPQHHTRWFSADIATHERGAQQDCTSCHEVEVTPTEVQRGADWGGVAGPVARTRTVCPVFALGLTRRCEAERHEEAEKETSSEAFRGSLRQSTCSRHFSTWNKWQLVQRRLAVATLTL